MKPNKKGAKAFVIKGGLILNPDCDGDQSLTIGIVI